MGHPNQIVGNIGLFYACYRLSALGKSLDGVIGDFWIIVDDVVSDAPKSYIMLPHEIRTLARCGGTYGGPSRWWLRPSSYAVSDFLEKWDRIGLG